MFEKNMKLAYLLDIYGDVLDEHTRRVMAAYYDDDLSLAEIAQDDGISRQGIRHLVKKGEEVLTDLENKLGLAAYYSKLSEAAKRLDAVAEALASGGEKERSLAGTVAEVSRLLTQKEDSE